MSDTSPSMAAEVTKGAMARATAAALEFLLRSQDDSGSWKDFMLPAGSSNVWVTAFVGDVLALRPEPEARAAVEAAWQFLTAAAKPDGGWSYNANVPGDADSTLWGLRMAASAGVEDTDTAHQALEFLKLHLTPDGGLATYATADPIREYVGLPPVIPFKGWTQSHLCVTAAGANLAQLRGHLVPYLLDHQREDGSWAAYWWFDDEYATAEAVTALAGDISDGSLPRDYRASIERAVEWGLKRTASLCESDWRQGHGFALAHALRILARSGDPDSVRKVLVLGVRSLIAHQQLDGSWAQSARLRVPRPDATTPKSNADWKVWEGLPEGTSSVETVLKHTFNNYSPDHYRVYSTATVLRVFKEISDRGLALEI